MNVNKNLSLCLLNYHDGKLLLFGQHEQMIFVHKDGKTELIDTIELGFPIGLKENIDKFVHESKLILQLGEGIVLYTDGITEAENSSGEYYEIERLCDAVSRSWNNSSEEIKKLVIDDVFNYIGNQEVYDDIALIVIKRR